MKEFKGTKGEWYLDGCHVVVGNIEHPSYSETVCDITPTTEYPTVHERSTNEAYNNARLIAAAPGLLEACQLALKDLVWLIEEEKARNPGSYRAETTISRCEAAINKALTINN